MVEFFKTIDGRITEINEFSEGCWVNMVHPSSDELAKIAVLTDPGSLEKPLTRGGAFR